MGSVVETGEKRKMKIYKTSKFEKLCEQYITTQFTQKQLESIILNVGKKVNLFSGNCGIFAIALAKFLNEIGNYNLQYMIYVNQGEDAVEDYFDGEPDIYHVILSVEGNGIDDFFDGHGSCSDDVVLNILKEYNQDFDTVTVIKLPVNSPRVETFIRSNTNYDSSSINENGIIGVLKQEYKKINKKDTTKSKSYQYLGTCISTVDDSCIWDATEMAQLIENSKGFDIHGIYPFLSSELKKKVDNNPSIVECGINNDIVWVYDSIDDIHYFYQKI